MLMLTKFSHYTALDVHVLLCGRLVTQNFSYGHYCILKSEIHGWTLYT